MCNDYFIVMSRPRFGKKNKNGEKWKEVEERKKEEETVEQNVAELKILVF